VLKEILTINTEKVEQVMTRNPIRIYEPPSSFIQVYLTNYASELISMMVSILKKSLPRSVSQDKIKSAVETYLYKNKNDLSFYRDLKKFYNTLYEPNPKEDVDFIRARSKYEKCKIILRKYSKYTPITKYLDYGGSTGAITSYFANELRLKKDNAYSLDIEQWQGTVIKKEYTNIKYITIKPTDSINLESNSFDLITCFQVLHHVNEEQINRTMKELHGLLKKNGLFIIREHDCNNDLTRLLIDIEHTVYECVTNNKDTMNGEYLCTYNDGEKYRSIDNWISYIESFGFKTVTEKDFSEDYLKNKLMDSYKISGETRYTYRFFKKI
jgi:SAM-dependent methyltransferase